MSHLSRQYSLKPQSLRKFLSGFFSLPDHHRQGGDIEDDWECIELFEQELAGLENDGDGAAGDGQGSEFGDGDHILFPLHSALVEVKYKILSKADILQRLEDKFARVSTVLLLSRSEAAILLHHFKWSVNKTEDEWLTCEEKVRKAVGLFDRRVIENPNAAERACGNCNANFPGDMMFGVSCGHQFCRSCWTGYISEAINDGSECLALRCPGSSCDAAVGLDMVELLASEADKKKFEDYLIRSYLYDTKKAKWCPAPGCEYAVLLSAGGDDSTVTCRCFYKFCWNCTEEAHTPVDCGTVVKWKAETTAQSENWLLANRRPCPNCRSSFLQSQLDLTYITCDVCDYAFCCKCGEEWWDKHGDGEMWMYKCYCLLDESLRPAGYRANDVREREIVKSSLERYNRVYEGWALNESSKANALEDLRLFQNVHLEMLCAVLSIPETELEFLTEAHLQIVECYRLLKWTHVYAYFLTEDEDAKRRLFEFMAEQAKKLLGLLQKHLKEVEDFLQDDVTFSQFMDFRRKLVLLTRVIRNYFDKMGEALKAGLPEVVSIPRPTSRPVKMCGEDRRRSSSNSASPNSEAMRGECSNNVSTISPMPKPDVVSIPRPTARPVMWGEDRSSSSNSASPNSEAMRGECSNISPMPKLDVSPLLAQFSAMKED